jgi:hypothetical protein
MKALLMCHRASNFNSLIRGVCTRGMVTSIISRSRYFITLFVSLYFSLFGGEDPTLVVGGLRSSRYFSCRLGPVRQSQVPQLEGK